MAIPNHPVWTIAPNWKTNVTERLEWLTDVLIGSNGNEQRRALRLSPRRTFEIAYNPIGNERTFFELSLHRQGGIEWFLPLFHDKGRLSVQANAGSSVLAFDCRWREFLPGGYAILLGRDAFTYEVVEIDTVDDGGLTLADPLTKTWGQNMSVYPLRVGRLDQESVVSALTRTVGEASLSWLLSGANDYPAEIDTGLAYGGRSVIVQEPNRQKGLQVSIARMLFTRDSTMGLRHVVDDAGRAFTSQVHDWQAVGREAQDRVRKMLYALNGRQTSVWLPTFNADVILSRPVADDATHIDIQKIGFEYLGGVGSGRNHIIFAGQVLEITGIDEPLSDDEERLVLAAPIDGNHAVGASGSFLDTARMDQESVEITHYADSDGAMEVSTAFRTFRDDRDASGIIFLPIPETAKSTTPCGTPVQASPCNPLFVGPFLTVVAYCNRGPVTRESAGGWLYSSIATQVYPPNGRYVAGSGANDSIYEYNSPVAQNNLTGELLVQSHNNQGINTWEFCYPFPGETFGEALSFELRLQYPSFSFAGFDDELWWIYQWWDMPNPSAPNKCGWIGGNWPVTYTLDIPNHTFGFEIGETTI